MKKSDLLLVIPAVIVVGLIGWKKLHEGDEEAAQARQQQAAVAEREAKLDPRLRAAQAEAKQRWPELVAVFAKHEPGTMCEVKAKFATADGKQEAVWVEVIAMDGDAIRARVHLLPTRMQDISMGDEVTVTRADAEDWLVMRDGKITQGAFTTPVLEQIEKEGRDKPPAHD